MRHFLLIAVVCCVVIPVYGQKPATKPAEHQQPSTDAQPPRTQTVNVDTVNVNTLNVVKQANAPDKANQNANKPPSYFCRLIAPENLPTLILCVIGAAGVGAAIVTYFAISRQATESKNATQAMRESTAEVKRQANFQEIAMQQWIEISGWRREGGSSREENPPRFTIAADLSNPTAVPLTVKSVSIRIVGEPTADYEVGNVLAPGGNPSKLLTPTSLSRNGLPLIAKMPLAW
jgi:flagellar basal body-associated protein FliL